MSLSHNIIGNESPLNGRAPVLGGPHTGWSGKRSGQHIWLGVTLGASMAVIIIFGVVGYLAQLHG